VIELATLFIPVAIICKNMSADSCEMIRYGGYFLTEKECQNNIQEGFYSKLKPGDRDRMWIDAWCVDVEIEKIDKKYLPKST
jgi:hypothetical protein